MAVRLINSDVVTSIDRTGKKTYGPRAVTYTYTDGVTSQSRPRPKDLLRSLTARERFREEFNLVKPGIHWNSGYQSFYYLESVMGTGVQNRLRAVLDLNDSCDMKMLGRIKDQNTNLAVLIPELGKTTDLLVSGLQDMLTVLRHAKRGNLAAAMKALRGPTNPVDKQMAKRFLEYSYGYVPLANDVHGLSLELERALVTGVDVRGSCWSGYDRRLTYDYYGSVDVHCTGKRRNSWVYTIDSGGLKTASSLGFSNPLAVAWELVPYSFMVDWFVGVGDWISGLDAGVGVRNFYCSRSFKVKYSGTAQCVRAPARPDSRVSGEFYARNMRRSVPFPSIQFKSPGLRHLALALSLLRIQR